MSDGTEPVTDDELLYRRIPVSKRWYDPQGLSPEAFEPLEADTTGISISRAKYKSIEEAAVGPSKQGYYVAVFRAGDLQQHGIRVVPRPQPGDPGHAELPDLTYGTRRTPEAEERKLLLSESYLRVEGPFPVTK